MGVELLEAANTRTNVAVEFEHAGGEIYRVNSFEEFKNSACKAAQEMSETGLQALYELAGGDIVLETSDASNDRANSKDKNSDGGNNHIVIDSGKEKINKEVLQTTSNTESSSNSKPRAASVTEIVQNEILPRVIQELHDTSQNRETNADTTAKAVAAEPKSSVPDIRSQTNVLSEIHQREHSLDRHDSSPQTSKKSKHVKDSKIRKAPLPKPRAKKLLPVSPDQKIMPVEGVRGQKPEIPSIEFADLRSPQAPNQQMELPETDFFETQTGLDPMDGMEELAEMGMLTASELDTACIDSLGEFGENDELDSAAVSESAFESITPAIESDDLDESFLVADGAETPVSDEAMEIYREILQIQLESIYDLQDSTESEPLPDSSSSERPVARSAEIAETPGEDEIFQRLKLLLRVELRANALEDIDDLQAGDESQGLEQSLLQIAILRPNKGQDLKVEADGAPMALIETAILNVTLAFENALRESHGLYYPPAITPELTQSLLELVSAMGYENPGEQLITFLHKYDVEVLIEIIIRLRNMLDAGDRQRQAQSASTKSGHDDDLVFFLGSYLSIFVTISPGRNLALAV